MKIEQNIWNERKGWLNGPLGGLGDKAQLVLIFCERELLKKQQGLAEIKKAYPKAKLMGCSTAGEIFDTRVTDDHLAISAISFGSTKIQGAQVGMAEVKNSHEAGVKLAKSIEHKGLVHLFVLSDGVVVNGSELVRGLTENLPANVAITGGVAGDGANFKETYVFFDQVPQQKVVAVLGFYGKDLKVGYGSLGGWDPFGPFRQVTKSKGNILYELDGKSALGLYKQYLGDQAKGLPATGLLYPLEVRVNDQDRAVVRTILSVSEQEDSMTFAGDVPEGAHARLMKANFDHLIDGALSAAKVSREILGSFEAELAILISCVGRKLVLAQRVEEEVEGVREVLGKRPALIGFYSYGEIAPFKPQAKCELHNQTMTITVLAEE
ncbi:MAG: FIST C-terminal domain-containing protein [Candidatus Margulisbacteria bacterium]|nr:FIST C-terminal domain-containing protein [Candidatus Margulisiibacteriota bacterium]MBU1021291.1 FIST C-terminal domain-containing protein [Candidatus Margulisiibacteriota bacterium]MBU1729220.1 FIST C-terminal domain-containing protein [Candidatus Margulisiibacteriota bacterium]MBU1954893.1 FIST C-terminal domain-containing protein [Candidatus Margulisiibacteriota bacterium]